MRGSAPCGSRETCVAAGARDGARSPLALRTASRAPAVFEASRRPRYVKSQCAHHELTVAATLIQDPEHEWVGGGGHLEKEPSVRVRSACCPARGRYPTVRSLPSSTSPRRQRSACATVAAERVILAQSGASPARRRLAAR